MKNFMLITGAWFFSMGILFAQTPVNCTFLADVPGPVGRDTSQYATIYLIRPDYPKYQDLYCYIMLNNLHYVKTNNNEKYLIQVYKPGAYEVWTGAQQRTSVHLILKPGETFYIELTLKEAVPYPLAQLRLLEKSKGVELFSNSTCNLIHIDYPIPKVKDLPLTRKETMIRYASPEESQEYGWLMVSPPSWAHHFEYIPFYGVILYSYYDPWVSETFSEMALLYNVGNKTFKDSVEFLGKLEKTELDELVRKKGEVLTTEKQVYFSLPGNMNYCFYTESIDSLAANRGSSSALKIKSYTAFIYIQRKGKGKYYKIFYSERGISEELHSDELFKCRFMDFVGKIKIAEE